jgi:hypothetical protein
MGRCACVYYWVYVSKRPQEEREGLGVPFEKIRTVNQGQGQF